MKIAYFLFFNFLCTAILNCYVNILLYAAIGQLYDINI